MRTYTCDDCDFASGYCDRTLQLLLRTFVDILLLRKGPDAIPHSSLVMAFAAAMLIVASLTAVTAIDVISDRNHLSTLISALLGILFYAAVLMITGFANRFVQTITAMMACGAFLTFLLVALYVPLESTLGRMFAGVVADLIILWSVAVEGHIISKAIEQHWIIGVTIAVTVLILQLGIESAFRAPA